MVSKIIEEHSKQNLLLSNRTTNVFRHNSIANNENTLAGARTACENIWAFLAKSITSESDPRSNQMFGYGLPTLRPGISSGLGSEISPVSGSRSFVFQVLTYLNVITKIRITEILKTE